MKIWILILISLLTIGMAQGAISPKGGFFEDNIEVTLLLEEGQYAIYTLDGTNPRLNGTIANENIIIEKRSNEPSSLASNTNITIWPYSPPNSTLKATPLRLVIFDEEDNEVKEIFATYFIGFAESDFKVPVFSVIINPEYLEDYELGMYIKGKIYDESVLAGSNPLSPFTDANWNSKLLRYPSHYELFENGELMINDTVRLQTSGRWSSALPMKSWKISYRYDKTYTDYPFFGNETTPLTRTVRFRTGSQDLDNGILMRDCLGALIFKDTEQEVMNCRAMALFLNGEYWGSYNLREDVDNRHFGYKYGINHKDIVMLEKDGIIDEGSSGDNIPYFELRDWLMDPSTDLSVTENYERFVSEVNPISLIDYYTCHIFLGNLDFPNDHFFWRNKNPDSQVPGTPIDGRWQYFCKDLDQSMGLYSRPDNSSSPHYNTLDKYLFDEDMYGWHTIFLRKAFENDEFKELFFNRSFELLDTVLSPNTTSFIVENYRTEKAHEIPRQVERWNKPSNFGSWNHEVDKVKNWIIYRHGNYTGFLMGLIENDTIEPPIEPPVEPPQEPLCYNSVVEISALCNGGIITLEENISGGGKRVICENEDSKLHITAWNKNNNQYFEMYKQEQVGSGIEICLADSCLQIGVRGFERSEDFPICVEIPEEPVDPPEEPPIEPPVEPPEEPICYNTVVEIPVECQGGTITSQEELVGGGVRIICEQDDNLLHITAWNKSGGQYYEMYKQQEEGTGITICIGEECISISGTGFRRSQDFPICI